MTTTNSMAYKYILSLLSLFSYAQGMNNPQQVGMPGQAVLVGINVAIQQQRPAQT